MPATLSVCHLLCQTLHPLSAGMLPLVTVTALGGDMTQLDAVTLGASLDMRGTVLAAIQIVLQVAAATIGGQDGR
jgi:hypothetical protein